MSKLCKDCACENVCGITHLPEDKACGFYYKADAITELEKIKTEIVLLQSEYEYNSETEYYKVGRCEAHEEDLEIIDNHIKELKGE